MEQPASSASNSKPPNSRGQMVFLRIESSPIDSLRAKMRAVCAARTKRYFTTRLLKMLQQPGCSTIENLLEDWGGYLGCKFQPTA